MKLSGWQTQIQEIQELTVVHKNTKMNLQKYNFEILNCNVSIKSKFFL